MTGAHVLNSAQSIVQSRDELFAQMTYGHAQLPMPDTAFASSHHDTEDLIKMVGGTPLIIKLFAEQREGRGFGREPQIGGLGHRRFAQR